MRALFLSNFYPPYGQGGYEMWCQEIVEGLHTKAHTVLVLTSRHAREQIKEPEPAWVRRELHLEMELKSLRNSIQFFTRRQQHESENLACLRQLIADFQPDVVLIWGMWNLAHTLPVLAEQLLPGRVVYYIGDYWPTLPSQHELYWQAPARDWTTHLPKQLLGFFARRRLMHAQRPVPQFGHVLFPTHFMRKALERLGMVAQHTSVIYGAADTSHYASAAANAIREPDTLALLYAGRVTPDKGVHVAIEAVAQLVHQQGLHNLMLHIVGDGDADYGEQLRDLVRRHNLHPYVQFRRAQPKAKMPQLYAGSDIFLFTSIWQEPFGRVLIEAMAAGAVVVGSPTGGAAEILVDGENALTFPPGDATALASQIKRLADDPALRRHLAVGGRQRALERFDTARMTAEIEAYLQGIVDQ